MDKHGAKVSISDKESSVTFTKAKVLQSVKFLLSNCFFKLWNEVFQEIIGIPTGKDTANIFCELISLILWNLVYSKTKNLEGLCALEMFFRLIDDLSALNDWAKVWNKSNLFPWILIYYKELLDKSYKKMIKLNFQRYISIYIVYMRKELF